MDELKLKLQKYGKRGRLFKIVLYVVGFILVILWDDGLRWKYFPYYVLSWVALCAVINLIGTVFTKRAKAEIYELRTPNYEHKNRSMLFLDDNGEIWWFNSKYKLLKVFQVEIYGSFVNLYFNNVLESDSQYERIVIKDRDIPFFEDLAARKIT
ncbi:MAG: hypothetical protein LBT88_03390 [Oscillospiraceae bacterium]|jgi:hypothetical protein|nr:hypothetical protein [Oscillospiraceae bacterium]